MAKIDFTYTRDKAVQAFRYIEDHLAPNAPKERIMEELRQTCLAVAHHQQDAIEEEKTFNVP